MYLELKFTGGDILLLAIFVMTPPLKCYVATLGFTVLNWASASAMETLK